MCRLVLTLALFVWPVLSAAQTTPQQPPQEQPSQQQQTDAGQTPPQQPPAAGSSIGGRSVIDPGAYTMGGGDYGGGPGQARQCPPSEAELAILALIDPQRAQECRAANAGGNNR